MLQERSVASGNRHKLFGRSQLLRHEALDVAKASCIAAFAIGVVCYCYKRSTLRIHLAWCVVQQGRASWRFDCSELAVSCRASAVNCSDICSDGHARKTAEATDRCDEMAAAARGCPVEFRLVLTAEECSAGAFQQGCLDDNRTTFTSGESRPA